MSRSTPRSRTERRPALKPVEVVADDVAFLQYTGGTTGVSKGATLLHRNVLANVEQLRLWLDDAYTVQAEARRI